MGLCKECKAEFRKHSNKLGAIYTETKTGVNVDYFICHNCLNVDKHYHTLNKRHGWSHLYGDISGRDLDWMVSVVGKTLDTVCSSAGYSYLNKK